MTEKKKRNNNVKAHDRFFKKSMSYPEIAQEFFLDYQKFPCFSTHATEPK
jgi:hypothetical protein